ncbi:MAG: hypothetical protein P4L33_02615 [Capsulimonadaceae bacterium]|nr:hypothetical protein [Capsulimonadaceae bacterium]
MKFPQIFFGDHKYSVFCNDDVVVNDEIRYGAPIVVGPRSFGCNSGYEVRTATVVDDYYDYERYEQHVFVLEYEDGSREPVPARFVYNCWPYRTEWVHEYAREIMQDEKHRRGTAARRRKRRRTYPYY